MTLLRRVLHSPKNFRFLLSSLGLDFFHTLTFRKVVMGLLRIFHMGCGGERIMKLG